MRPKPEIDRLIRAMQFASAKMIKQGNLSLATECTTIGGYLLWATGQRMPILQVSIDLLVNECEAQISEGN